MRSGKPTASIKRSWPSSTHMELDSFSGNLQYPIELSAPPDAPVAQFGTQVGKTVIVMVTALRSMSFDSVRP